MNKFSFPVLLPPGIEATVTQPFGVTANTIEPPGQHGEAHFHYGDDVVFGTDIETYGTPIVCPFHDARLTAYAEPSGSYTVTPFIRLDGYGASGNHYEATFAHVSSIFFRPSYNEGDIIGTVGNYGLVLPKPTPGAPFAGSHLHLGLQLNGQWVDPLQYFDITKPYIGAPHDPASDIPRLVWAIQQIESQLSKMGVQ